MTDYSTVKAIDAFSMLDKLDEITLKKLNQTMPSIPKDYIEFLREVGSGDLNNTLMLYSGLVSPSDIYDETSELANIKIFADDYQGFCFGFDTTNWAIIEIEPISKKIRVISATFEEFIQKVAAELN